MAIKTPYDYLTEYPEVDAATRKKMDDVRAIYTRAARALEAAVPGGPEKTAGMRKLLEAKDCHVRSFV